LFLQWILFLLKSSHFDHFSRSKTYRKNLLNYYINIENNTNQRWSESEKLTPNPAQRPSLPCFYIHSIYIIPFIPNPAPDPKSVSGLRIRAHLWHNTTNTHYTNYVTTTR